VKGRVFKEACLLMIGTGFDIDDVVVNTVLSLFPDDSKISDKMS
jgi:hypothetical protein